MIYEYLKERLILQSVFENVYGLSVLAKKQEVSKSLMGTKTYKNLVFPAVNLQGKVVPLIPNSKKRDLVYFERYGDLRKKEIGNVDVNEEEFDVVIWINKEGFELEGEIFNGDLSAVVREVKRAFKKPNFIIDIEFLQGSTENVFLKYTFGETENAMIMHPFKSYRLRFRILYLANCENLIRKEIDCLPKYEKKCFRDFEIVNTIGAQVGEFVNDRIVVADSTYTLKNTADDTIEQGSILAERSKDITIQDSQVTLKNTKDEILSSENILAEGSKEITAPNSNFKITDFSGNTFIEGEIASGASEEFEIWAKDYRPLIFKYDTRLTGDNEIILRGTGNYEKHIAIKDIQGDILEEYWTTDSNVINTNHPVGEYYVEIRQRAGNYYTSNTNTATNQTHTLTEIVQFGDVIWNTGDLAYLYQLCSELTITAKDEMKFRKTGDITRIRQAFQGIKGVAETTWIEQFPWSKVQGDANNFFRNTSNFAKDTLELDFKDADILGMGNFFLAYQIGGSKGIQTLIIKNMETCVNMTGNIFGSSFPWTNGMQKVIFQGLQVSQNMSVWRPTDPINIMLFFLNLGDRTGETQSTITIRNQEWDLLTQEQQEVIEDILVNKNWALALN